jgi:hypothetical protein
MRSPMRPPCGRWHCRAAKQKTLSIIGSKGAAGFRPNPHQSLPADESARQHPMMTPTPRQNIPPWPAIQAAITIPPQRASKDQLSELMVTSRHSSLRSGCKAADAISPARSPWAGRPRRAGRPDHAAPAPRPAGRCYAPEYRQQRCAEPEASKPHCWPTMHILPWNRWVNSTQVGRSCLMPTVRPRSDVLGRDCPSAALPASSLPVAA